MTEQVINARPLSSSLIPGLVLVVFALLVAAYAGRDSLGYLFGMWFGSEEYSHAPLIPLICVYLVWQRRKELARIPTTGSWVGFGVASAGSGLILLGRLATLQVLEQYGLLILLYGLLLALIGAKAFRLVLVPLLLLFFVIPLPQFLLQNFSAALQLISSRLGVAVIRFCGISVFVEGNVIDLGTYQLQVAEACSGLRYLFPLMTIGLIVAYLYRDAMWKRVLLFLSSIPITVLMNSFRVGMIGVLVDRWGTSMAEGFIHQFEGWVVFMISLGVLLIEMRVLSALGGHRRSWRDYFSLETSAVPAVGPAPSALQGRILPYPLLASVAAVGLVVVTIVLMPVRFQNAPQRQSFANFPLRIANWTGKQDALDPRYLDTLKLDDYLLADYTRPGHQSINFYVAWYNSQVAGEAVHSPRSCLPGGGWQVSEFGQRDLSPLQVVGHPLRVNRAVTEYGLQRQVVYYWFQQRGRVITNEYLVKWYLFIDSLRLHRADGALVRLVVVLRPDQTPADGDQELIEFASSVLPQLDSYIPD